MKKIILVVISIFALTLSASAERSEKNAIGLRLGYGAEISYQRSFLNDNRVEIDLGIGLSNSVTVSAAYQWVWNIKNGFDWYAGVGAGVGLWDKRFSCNILGQIGVEYNFSIPLTLSLDWRPGVLIVPTTRFMYEGFMLGVRYRF